MDKTIKVYGWFSINRFSNCISVKKINKLTITSTDKQTGEITSSCLFEGKWYLTYAQAKKEILIKLRARRETYNNLIKQIVKSKGEDAVYFK